MQKIHLRREWLADYALDSQIGVHPALDDVRTGLILRKHLVRSAVVYRLRYPATVSRLAEMGMVTVGMDESAERIRLGRREAEKQSISHAIFVTGGLALIDSQVDLMWFDSVGLENPEVSLAVAKSLVRRRGLLAVIAETGRETELGDGWRILESSDYRMARIEGLLDGVLVHESALIAIRKR